MTAVEWSPGAAGPLLGDDPGELAWQDKARCAEVDGDLFFPPRGGSSQGAKLICRGCEVRTECLEYALEHDMREGIWGGLSENQRRRIRAERREAAA